MLNVMEIERFAVHDGPGIRTTVFLKGCALHCPWCANPESQSPDTQLLYDAGACVHCGACQVSCPTGAARACTAQGGVPCFDRAVCTACGACVRVCPQGAITLCGTQKTPQEIADICLRDKDYYDESGGGVTLSGGEALLAGESLLPLLALLHRHGIHVAVETCGQFPPDALKALLPQLDLFLFDVKHANAQKLHEVTGANAALILQNLAAAASSGKPVVARVPVIPGFNHTKQEMDDIFALCEAHAIRQVNLLPYHTLGKGKYAKLGRDNAWPAPMLQSAELTPYVSLAAQHGLTAVIGG